MSRFRYLKYGNARNWHFHISLCYDVRTIMQALTGGRLHSSLFWSFRGFSPMLSHLKNGATSRALERLHGVVRCSFLLRNRSQPTEPTKFFMQENVIWSKSLSLQQYLLLIVYFILWHCTWTRLLRFSSLFSVISTYSSYSNSCNGVKGV